MFDSLSEIRLLAQGPLRFRRQLLALKHYFAQRGCTALFLLEWLGIAGYTWRKRGPLPAAIALVTAPATGYVAVRFAEALRDATPERAAG